MNRCISLVRSHRLRRGHVRSSSPPLGLELLDGIGVIKVRIPFAAVVGANAGSLAVALDQVVEELEADPALGLGLMGAARSLGLLDEANRRR